NLTNGFSKSAETVSGAVGSATSKVSGTASKVSGAAATAATTATSTAKKGGSKILPLLGVGLAVVAGFFLWKSCGSDVKNAVGNVKDGVTNVAGGAADMVKDGASAVTDAAGNVKDGVANVAGGAVDAVKDGASAVGGAIVEGADAIYSGGANLVGKTVKGFEHLGTFVSRKLSDGTELVIPNKGFEYNLVDFIESDKAVDKTTWFNLRRVLFKTGSSNLDERSMSQIENIAKILKAYPAVALKIGGYTDNTGNVNANKALSARRAKAVVDALVAKGVAKSRLASEGYGVEHPVADNNTEEGRALNRRVAARVTKK
ncbi:MAG: OmpA family protein, partial [Flavobacteriaceae bacterium]|nr:OmpA family protein [Flavobacteriaceae bacterium]